jgi:hypothetical protein
MEPHLEMLQWVIYDHPRDYSDKFVARLWKVSAGRMIATEEMHLADTLEEVRGKVPQGLYRLARFLDDDPCIVEVWL